MVDHDRILFIGRGRDKPYGVVYREFGPEFFVDCSLIDTFMLTSNRLPFNVVGQRHLYVSIFCGGKIKYGLW